MARPPFAHATPFTPRPWPVPGPNDIVAARFTADDTLYRARITRVDAAKVAVVYVDYGNVCPPPPPPPISPMPKGPRPRPPTNNNVFLPQ